MHLLCKGKQVFLQLFIYYAATWYSFSISDFIKLFWLYKSFWLKQFWLQSDLKV